MSCMLRISGRIFDVDKALLRTKLKPCVVYKKGEPRVRNNLEAKWNSFSEINIETSKAGLDQFDEQIADTIDFLEKNKSTLKELLSFPGVESRRLNFSIEKRDVTVQGDLLPPELQALAGELDLDLDITLYPK